MPRSIPCSLIALISLFSTVHPLPAQSAASPYNLSVFALAPTGLSAPDSVAVLGDYVFVGYGDNHAPDGSDGLNSQVVQYRTDGSVVYTYTVPGHNDGVKIDPSTTSSGHCRMRMPIRIWSSSIRILITRSNTASDLPCTAAATTTLCFAVARFTSAHPIPQTIRIRGRQS